MAYKVEYTTNDYPTGLPAGAKVEKLSELPLSINTGTSKTIKVQRSVDTDAGFLHLESGHGSRIGAHLTKEQTRRVAHALLETIGEEATANPVPTVVKDGEGDHWVLDPDNGQYSLTYGQTERDEHTGAGNSTLTEIRDGFSGYTVIR